MIDWLIIENLYKPSSPWAMISWLSNWYLTILLDCDGPAYSNYWVLAVNAMPFNFDSQESPHPHPIGLKSITGTLFSNTLTAMMHAHIKHLMKFHNPQYSFFLFVTSSVQS